MEYRDGWERFACSGSVADYLSYKENECGRMRGHSEGNRVESGTEEGCYAGLHHGDGDGFENHSRG